MSSCGTPRRIFDTVSRHQSSPGRLGGYSLVNSKPAKVSFSSPSCRGQLKLGQMQSCLHYLRPSQARTLGVAKGRYRQSNFEAGRPAQKGVIHNEAISSDRKQISCCFGWRDGTALAVSAGSRLRWSPVFPASKAKCHFHTSVHRYT